LNKNELSHTLLIEIGLRKAFIFLIQWVFKRGIKMNRRILIFVIVGILLISSVAAMDLASALPSTLGKVANRLTQATWIRLNGNLDQLITITGDIENTATVRGQLQAQARAAVRQSGVTKQLTVATAMWTTETQTAAEKAKESGEFTYTYYIARLPDASVSDSDSKIESPTSYTLAGTWKIAKVVLTVTTQTNEDGTVTKHREQAITPTQSTGTLTVSDNTFTLLIEEVGILQGSIYRSITRSWFNPFKMTDDSTGTVVTRTDVKTIAEQYGTMPGWGNFDLKMDFNNNYRVDIADISTVAANM
jgi:hypothetical protein